MVLLMAAGTATAQVDVGAYIRKDKFADIKLSPSGAYFAATVPMEDKTALAIMRRSDNSIGATFVLEKNTYVSDFAWVSDTRVLIPLHRSTACSTSRCRPASCMPSMPTAPESSCWWVTAHAAPALAPTSRSRRPKRWPHS
ncbi:UNVERIFIED_ORG: hypothetical protein ABIB63_003144 [Xanthomonas axonopodis]